MQLGSDVQILVAVVLQFQLPLFFGERVLQLSASRIITTSIFYQLFPSVNQTHVSPRVYFSRLRIRYRVGEKHCPPG